MGWWWPPSFGVWAGTYTLTIGLLEGLAPLHVLVLLAAVWWMRRVRGTYPTGKSPRELRGPFVMLFGGAGLVGLAAWGCYEVLGVWAAASAAALLSWALVAAYERSYDQAAARVRERLT